MRPFSALLLISLALYACKRDDRVELQLLETHYAPLIRKMSREVTVFHWAPHSAVTPDEVNYVKTKAHEFWDPRRDLVGVLGNGLYASTDPASSRQYGHGEDWALVTIGVPEGTRFLDLRDGSHEFQIPAAITQGLEDRGCDFITNVKSLFESGSPVCREILNQMLLDLHVQAVVYDYVSSVLADCPADRTDAAFLLLDSGMDLSSVRLYLKQVPVPDPQKEGRELIEHLLKGVVSLWPELDAVPFTPDPSYKNQIFGCGKYAEDEDPRSQF